MRKITLFDQGWKFHPGDKKAERPYWGYIKSGVHNQTWADQTLDDSHWRDVELPHDFVMETDITPPNPDRDAWRIPTKMDFFGDLHVARGAREGGVGWYRKHFWADGKEGKVWLRFDGIYRDCQVYLNDYLVAEHKSGYTGFLCDITDFLRDGQENVLAVRVDASLAEGWFYEGGGIYRHVWLIQTPEIAVKQHGVFVHSKVDPKTGIAHLTMETTIHNHTEAMQEQVVSQFITAPDGTQWQAAQDSRKIPGGEDVTLCQETELADPMLWDLECPQLYRLRTVLSNGDEVETEFGIRTICFDAEHGFFLNGKPVKIKGVCCHQDHAGLGNALPDGMQYYRISKLKEMGCNAYRCAHNPATNELLQACDRLGMLVMNENRLLSSSPDGMEQLEEMVCSSRNHPSVILFSLCNEEVNIQFTKQGQKIAETMKRRVHKLDPTRPVTAAVCMWEAGKLGQTVQGTKRQGMLVPSVDVFGFNYFDSIWDDFHKAFPDTPLVVSEDCSFSETRGCRISEDAKCQMSAMDQGKGSYLAGQKEWIAAADREYLAGTFVWTGFDYHGEPAPYGWPAVVSQFGIMDLCGFPKDTYYYYKAWWGKEPVLHLCTDETDLWCITNCKEVELFSDGVSLGKRNVEKNRIQIWEDLGNRKKLTAIGYGCFHSAEEEMVRAELPEAGMPKKIQAEVDWRYPEADGSETVVVNITLVDENGGTALNAENQIAMDRLENMVLLGTGNGNPSDHDSVKAPYRRAFHGKLQVILRAFGRSSVRLSGLGLEETLVEIG